MKNSFSHFRSLRHSVKRSIHPSFKSLTTKMIPSLNRVLLIYVSKSFVIVYLFFHYNAFHLKDYNNHMLSFVWLKADGSQTTARLLVLVYDFLVMQRIWQQLMPIIPPLVLVLLLVHVRDMILECSDSQTRVLQRVRMNFFPEFDFELEFIIL